MTRTSARARTVAGTGAVTALALLVLALAVGPWAGQGTLASAAQAWGDGRPDVHGELTPVGDGTARLTLWNGGGLPARVFVTLAATADGSHLRLTVREVTDGAVRLLYTGSVDGAARLDLGELGGGAARTLEVEAAAPGALAPTLQVGWSAVAGG